MQAIPDGDGGTDAVVIGGGFAGLAAAIHLARGGLRVICLEPRKEFPHIVGESLDWSAPDLLTELDLPMEELVKSNAGTYKRHIVLHTPDGLQQEYSPNAKLAGAPMNVELRTMHLDRLRVHERLLETAAKAGVRVLHERAVVFRHHRRKIAAVETSAGRLIRAAWFLDASGADASVLAREFRCSSVSYGPRKVAIWSHVAVENCSEGTSLYALAGLGHYMSWLWEIPVRRGVSSLGYVAPGVEVKAQRRQGLTNAQILKAQLRRYSNFHPVLQRGLPTQVAVTSFLCRTYLRPCNVNWIIIGEAASQSDPITGNGVTAALRHASEASALVLHHRHLGHIPLVARAAYNLRVLALGCFFNSLIEKIYYEPFLRARVGLFRAADLYTVPAWSMNLIYSRVRPRGLLRTVLFCSVLAAVQLAAWSCFTVAQRLNRRPRTRFERRAKPDALQLSR